MAPRVLQPKKVHEEPEPSAARPEEDAQMHQEQPAATRQTVEEEPENKRRKMEERASVPAPMTPPLQIHEQVQLLFQKMQRTEEALQSAVAFLQNLNLGQAAPTPLGVSTPQPLTPVAVQAIPQLQAPAAGSAAPTTPPVLVGGGQPQQPQQQQQHVQILDDDDSDMEGNPAH